MSFLLPFLAPGIEWLVQELSDVWSGGGDLFSQDSDTDDGGCYA